MTTANTLLSGPPLERLVTDCQSIASENTQLRIQNDQLRDSMRARALTLGALLESTRRLRALYEMEDPETGLPCVLEDGHPVTRLLMAQVVAIGALFDGWIAENALFHLI